MLPVNYNDPAPSVLRYRFERLWLKPSVRALVRVWIPLALAAGTVWALSGNPAVRAAVDAGWNKARDAVAARPELQVSTVAYPGASEALQAQIAALVPLELPVSSLDLDVVKIKEAVESLDAVKSAEVTVQGGGVLEIRAAERAPVLVWRDGDVLRLIDGEGQRVAEIARRAARPDLPLVVGTGADLAVSEIAALVEVLAPINGRLRGFVRVGERRWDVVLDRGQTIMLPENGAVTALRKVLSLHADEDLLNRDVVVVDMRNPDRPVLRLSENAVQELRRLRAIVRGEHA